jgi:uncharacterized protein with gpF-like domain
VVIYRAHNAMRDREARRIAKAVGLWYAQRGDEVAAKLEGEPSLRQRSRVRQPKVSVLTFEVAKGGDDLGEAVLPILREAYERTGQQAMASTGVDTSFNVDNPRARELLRQREQEMKSVAATAEERVRATLAEGLAEGETVEQLTARVDGWVAEGQEQYSEVVARTESGIVMGTAADEAYHQAGATGEEWLAIVDGRSGPRAHDEMDGVVVGIDEDFTLPSGATCRYPGDPSLDPDDLCNCRCTVAAVFDGNGGSEQ